MHSVLYVKPCLAIDLESEVHKETIADWKNYENGNMLKESNIEILSEKTMKNVFSMQKFYLFLNMSP